MQRSFSLQITDLEFIESGVEQKITLENAEKILGGKKDDKYKPPEILPISDPPCPERIIADTISRLTDEAFELYGL